MKKIRYVVIEQGKRRPVSKWLKLAKITIMEFNVHARIMRALHNNEWDVEYK